MKARDLPLFKDPEAKKLLQNVCQKHGITPSLLRELLEVERDFAGSGRKVGITEAFSERLAAFLEEDGAR